MSGYSELIKNFAKTRDYVRDFFIYGCKSRSDFRKSPRTYDDEKRRAESWLGDCIKYDDTAAGRRVFISVDSGRSHKNPLYQAYNSRSFTDNDIRLHFCLLDILREGEWLTLNDITEQLDGIFPEPFDVQTVRSKLREYVSEGIFETEKRGKTAYFRISPDETTTLIEHHSGLDEALRFFSCSQEFGVVGDTILNAAELENDIFLTKHNYIVHTLEDDIVLHLVEAMDGRCAVETESFGSSTKRRLIPMQILSSLQTGRRYIAAWDADSERYTSSRLDFIKAVKICGKCDDYDELHAGYLTAAARSFGVSFGGRHDAEPLRIEFTLNEETESYILRRLRREKRCGVLERVGTGRYAVTFDVADPQEVMHWAKSFIGRIVSIEGGTESVRETFFSDIRRMAEMYGGAP